MLDGLLLRNVRHRRSEVLLARGRRGPGLYRVSTELRRRRDGSRFGFGGSTTVELERRSELELIGRNRRERLDFAFVPLGDRGFHGRGACEIGFDRARLDRERELLSILGIAGIRRNDRKRVG